MVDPTMRVVVIDPKRSDRAVTSGDDMDRACDSTDSLSFATVKDSIAVRNCKRLECGQPVHLRIYQGVVNGLAKESWSLFVRTTAL
jgi:hypothetical protein